MISASRNSSPRPRRSQRTNNATQSDSPKEFNKSKQREQRWEARSPPFPLLPPVSRFCVRSGGSYYPVVDSICAIRRAEPVIATQVVGRALDGGCNATGRESSNKLPYRIGGCSRRRSRSRGCVARGCAGVVSGVVSVG